MDTVVETMMCVTRSSTVALPDGVTIEDAGRLVHGQQGVVVGLGSKAASEVDFMTMQFAGAKRHIDCCLEILSREPPLPLPGGYKLGESLYYIGASQTLTTGDAFVHGILGEVVGPVTSGERKGLLMNFPGQNEMSYKHERWDG